MGPICCPETSVMIHHSTLRKIPEKHRSDLHRGGRLKSPKLHCIYSTSETQTTLYLQHVSGTNYITFTARRRHKLHNIHSKSAAQTTLHLQHVSGTNYITFTARQRYKPQLYITKRRITRSISSRKPHCKTSFCSSCQSEDTQDCGYIGRHKLH
jgi:hypothetical protein